MIPEVTLSFDGSCRRQGKPNASAGWGLHVSGPGINHQDYGRVEGMQDSTRSEIYGLLMGCRWIDENPKAIINFKSDSKMLVDGIESLDIRRSLHPDLWDEITDIINRNKFRIKSFNHCPREENAVADALARKGSACMLRLKGGEVEGFDEELAYKIING